MQGDISSNTFTSATTRVLVFRTECIGSVSANNQGLPISLVHTDNSGGSGSGSVGESSTSDTSSSGGVQYGDYTG